MVDNYLGNYFNTNLSLFESNLFLLIDNRSMIKIGLYQVRLFMINLKIFL